MRFLAFSLCASLLSACQTPPAPGARCERAADCAAPLACHFGRCRAQCSANRDCGAAATCVLDADGVGSCTLETDLGCESGVGRECATGLLCVADHCLQSCGATSGCATGSVCTATGAGESFCAPSDLDAGSTRPDAAIDAGAVDAGPGSAVGTACIGDGFVCATRMSDGTVWCWGHSVAYALGAAPGDPGTGCLPPSGRDTLTALQVPTLAAVDQLVCGAAWACAHRTTDGAVLCWGESYGGILDPGHAICDRTPHTIVGVGGYVELSSSFQLACSLDRAAYTLTCWGSDQGTVHPQDPPPSPTMVLLPSSTLVDAIPTSAQPQHVAIDDGMPHADDSYGGGCYIEAAGGSVWCWGTNLGAQRGAPSTTRLLTTAAVVPGLPAGPVAWLAHGDSSNCVLVGGGDLWCWGIGNLGQLAHPPTTLAESCVTMDATYPCSSTPVPYTRFTFSRVASHGSAGASCGIALAGSGVTAGQVFCWGSGEFSANTRMDHAPVEDPLSGRVVEADGATPLSAARDVLVAFRNACAIDQAGALWCWGDNASQQLQLPSATAASGRAVRVTIP